MLDSIGLGDAIANVISLALLIVALGGGWVFFVSKHRYIAYAWMSILLNLLAVFYFMGFSGILPLAAFFFWPIVNILLIVSLVIKNINKKNEKN
ncbi:MAG: hypothetical protein A2259_05245 [Candidatus Moranbacteria bacterium RIFOXYA2_FULL_43_15]|nr:MAG: hypothetical protein A2259_05245 [Candidatus Moranbacteria bacterium RIFOXYA2_FULL_43_15]